MKVTYTHCDISGHTDEELIAFGFDPDMPKQFYIPSISE